MRKGWGFAWGWGCGKVFVYIKGRIWRGILGFGKESRELERRGTWKGEWGLGAPGLRKEDLEEGKGVERGGFWAKFGEYFP